MFVYKLINNKVIALISSLFLALNPWHFHYSRIGHEASISPFFYFLSLLLLLTALKGERYKLMFVFTGIITGISIYSYQVARVLSPILFIFLCAVYYKESTKKIKYVVVSALIAMTVAFPMIYSSVISPGELESRYGQVNIFHGKNVIGTFFSNYFTHFSPSFLFFKGDENNIPGMNGQDGMFLIYVAPLMIFGIYYLIKICRISVYKREIIVLFGLLLLYPLPTAITNPAPHALRAFTLIPIFEVISAIGVWYLFGTLFLKFLNKKVRLCVSFLSFLAIMYCFGNFVLKYYFIYPKYLEDYYQFGIKEAVEYIRCNQDRYNKIYFTNDSNQPFVYFLFYLNYDPAKYIKLQKDVNYKGFGVVHSFDKYYFVPDERMPLNDKKCLYVCKTSNVPGKELLKEIKNSNGRTAFTIWQ
jgi:4-amino-4-deoxy-L-arabinose transferase-like glycosyltransferase